MRYWVTTRSQEQAISSAPTNDHRGPLATPDGDALDWFELVHDSLIVRDLEGRVLACNQAAERLYGWQRADLVGRAAEALLTSMPVELQQAGEAAVLATGRWEGTLCRTTTRGADVHVEVRLALRRGPDGEPKQIIETGRDITERHHAQQALSASEYRYRNLFGAMAASFWELDFSGVGALLRSLRKAGVLDYASYFADHPQFVRQMMAVTRIIDINDETVRLFGRGQRQGLLEDLNHCWPDESLGVYAASVLAAVGGQSHFSSETRLRRMDGSLFDGLFTACFAPDAVAQGRLLIGVIDISERKRAFSDLAQSEARYRTLFQATAVAYLQYDASRVEQLFAQLQAQGVTDLAQFIDSHPDFLKMALENCVAIDVNDRAVTLFGANRREQVIGPITRLWIPNRIDAFRGSLEAAWNGELGYQAETVMRTIDGREIDVLFFMNWAPEMRAHGMALVGLFDITEQVNSRAALRRVQAELAHAGRVSMLGELTASIAHEVNQPLAAIATNGAAGLRWLARSEPDLNEARALMQNIIDDSRRAAEIIARIRGMSIRAPHQQSSVALNVLVREAVLFLQHELRSHQAHLTLELESALPRVMGDRVQLQQVIVNLLVNALQSMANAAVASRNLVIETRLTSSNEVQLRVLDSGPGIAEAHLPRLFESFFSTKSNGMGLGLPITRSIIESHGGSISAQNRADGPGAQFAFRLPAIAE